LILAGKNLVLTRILSGGQTGVDRAALDAAMELGIPHGGWCPRGRLAEDGCIPQNYRLKETLSPDYSVRTRLNVRDADGTLILYREPLEGGTSLTWQIAVELEKPVLLVEMGFPPVFEAFHRWLLENAIHTLNIAGPRESQRPGIYHEAKVLVVAWCWSLKKEV
jgi:hypothetical protein